ncbi:MAG: UbiX family flavin prenyltransferase [Clostridiales Family XIII bacterium]|jgi:4-hydroxy-3-polyprenylbenzoate decarboxylase|nr:UbiX family flavin prenyltransferase [Clostridiales Family XIII bacterium]
MKIIVGISGASGAIYGVRLLEALKALKVETHLIISAWGEYTIAAETGLAVRAVRDLASFCHEEKDMAACVSSGSFPIDAMAVAPCSMKTLAGIATGFTDDLITRAADVCLKERRKLILLTRESPLSVIHIENMLAAARAGAIVAPPVPAFYAKPSTIEDLVAQTVGRVLDHMGLPAPNLKRWGLTEYERAR